MTRASAQLLGRQDSFHEPTARFTPAAETACATTLPVAATLDEVVRRLHPVECARNVHSAGSKASTFSQNLTTDASAPRSVPSSRSRFIRFCIGSSVASSCAACLAPPGTHATRQRPFRRVAAPCGPRRHRDPRGPQSCENAFRCARTLDAGTPARRCKRPSGRCTGCLEWPSPKCRQAGSAAAGVDHERCHPGCGRGPQPTQLAPELPPGLVGVLDGVRTHRGQRFRVRRGQRGADRLLQVGDCAQSDRRGEHMIGDFFHRPLADVLTAREVRQGSGQTRPDAVSATPPGGPPG